MADIAELVARLRELDPVREPGGAKRALREAADALEAAARERDELKEENLNMSVLVEVNLNRAEAAKHELASLRRDAEHLRMQIGYIVTELMVAGDKRTLPEIVEAAAKATATRGSHEA